MSDFAAGLSRVSSKEKNQHKQGRSGGAVPKLKMGSGRAAKSGGINRPTKGYKHD